MPRRLIRYYSLVVWRRITAFLRRLLTPHIQPRDLARGAVIGLAVGLSPFLGLHFILTFTLAYLMRASKVMAFTFVFVSNPWTAIPILVVEGHIGEIVLHSEDRVFNRAALNTLIQSVERPRVPQRTLREYMNVKTLLDLLRAFPGHLWTIVKDARFMRLLWRMTIGWAVLALPACILTYFLIQRWASRIHLRRLRLPHWRRAGQPKSIE